jgi:D-alanyl-D-alanine endopeptidase (penicillin-binding protein 7)
MNRADIQAFLNSNSPFLSVFKTTDKNGVLRTASDIIYRASIDNEINPKYVLIKLQKEQSLITDLSPTQKQLDWATGYGVCDNCNMSDPSIQKHKGFGTQVDSAAGIMRWYYENVYSESWIKKPGNAYSIDGQTIQPANLATGFMYTYTPHILGNQNFWTLWNTWFEQRYPDGSLLKDSESSTIYLIQNGTKRAITSMSALISRFDPKFIITVPPLELTRYEDGPSLSLPNYSILKNSSKYYLLDYYTLRPFASYDTVKQLGYNPDEIIDVTSTDLADYTLGEVITASIIDPIGRVLKIKEFDKYYFYKNGVYKPITDLQMLTINFSEFTPETISTSDLGELILGEPVLFKNGILFGITGSNKIYVVENGTKRHIADEDVYNGLGYSWDNIIWTDQFTGMNHKTGEAIYLNSPIEEPIIVENTQTVATEKSEITESVETLEELMQRTPENETTYVGNKFTTNMDVYLIADANSGKILAGKNLDIVRPMASFTKVMTAYRLLQEGLVLSNIGTSTYVASKHKAVAHYFRVAENEVFRNKDLFYAMLISSLNTPSRILVDDIESYEPAFISRMNKQASEWGLIHTHFSDTYGYDLENKTTAREYLTIFQKATNNTSIRSVMGMKNYEYDEILDKDGKPHHYDEHSNELMKKTSLPYKIIASKTGYLYEAGDGLAMLIERNSDKKQFIIITMGNPDHTNRFYEPEKLNIWVINNF